MSGDYTRYSFDPRKRYSGVLMQQGRVQLDADWNEGVEVLKRRLRTLAIDSLGPVGVPHASLPDSFLLGLIAGPPADLSIEPGRLYVQGCVAELFPQESATYLTQPFLPDPPPLPAGNGLAYLDVWEREVTYIEDPALLDVALGGVDTSTRTQTIWQLRYAALREGAACGMPVGEPASAGRLTTEAIAPPAPDDPCILPPVGGYRGLENRLYRLEIHTAGALGTARFKWSRDNGSIVSAVTAMAVAGGETRLTVNRIGRDQVLRFRIDDWVTVTDDHRELMGEPGEMARVVDIDETNRILVLDRALPTGGGRAFGANASELSERHSRVQLWNQQAGVNAIDADGLMTTAAGPIDIEDGIRVRFAMDPAGGGFRVGDYWLFAARTADASVEELVAAPPRGIHHRYVQLAAINGLGGANPTIDDCRPRPEDGECCETVVVSPGESIQAAINALPPAGGAVCLKPGLHLITQAIVIARDNVLVKGESSGVLIRNIRTAGVFAIGRAEGIKITTVDMESAAGQENLGAVIAIAAARRVTIEDCGIRGLSEAAALLGVNILRADFVDIRRCRIERSLAGIGARGFCEGLRFEANNIRLLDVIGEIDGLAGILVTGVPAPLRIEGNTIDGALFGIAINDDAFQGGSVSASHGSLILSNRVICPPTTGTPAGNVRIVGIDCAADACILALNQISYSSPFQIGIRVTGAESEVNGNIVNFLGKNIEASGPVGIAVGFTGDAGAVPTSRILVAGNDIQGPQHGILVTEAREVTVEGNMIGSDRAPAGLAVFLSRVAACAVSGNQIRNALSAVSSLRGSDNRIANNEIRDVSAGVLLLQETMTAVVQNRIDAPSLIGAAGLLLMERCDFVENRLNSCGYAASIATGIAAAAVIGQLHVESNEVLDTGILPGRPISTRRAIGIFGDLVMEALIESNRVAYTDPNQLDPQREDRALLMRGYLEQRIPLAQTVLVVGFPIQILNNKFVGNGRSALVELMQLAVADNIFLRFERVIFSNNYCMHVSVPRNDTIATVVLRGSAAVVMGNQVKATQPGFFSVNFNNVPGPFIGNITAGGTLQHPDFPAPQNSFNLQM